MDILFSLDMGEADFGHLVSVTPSEHPTASAKLRVRPCDTAIQLHAFIPQATLREYLIVVLSEEHSTIALTVFPSKGVNEHTAGLSTSGCPSIDADLSARCEEAFLRPFLGSDYSFTHRHQPEIATHLGADVIFTPHLGNFPRGILETITCRLKSGVTQAQVAQVLQQAYAHKPLVRLYDKGVPALKNVVGLPFCDIGFAVQGEHLIIVATEDNLLKGAAAQAVQCANIRFGYAETQSLI